MYLANVQARKNNVYLLSFTYIALALITTLFWGDISDVQRISSLAWVQTNYALIHWLSDNMMFCFYLWFLCMLVYGYKTNKTHLLRIAQSYFIAQLVGSVALVTSLKRLAGHIRPMPVINKGADHISQMWLGPTLDMDFHGFPSGHTCDYLTSCMFIAFLLPKRWMQVLVMLLAMAQGAFRICLAKHFPVDVLGGAIIGSLSTYAIWTYWLAPKLSTAKSIRQR